MVTEVRYSVVGAVLALLIAGCGGGPDTEAFQLLQEHPLANPTLSFAVPTEFNGSAGSSSGIQSQTRLSVGFEIADSRLEQAITELLAQAEAAGLEMERRNSGSEGAVRYTSANTVGPDVSIGSGAPQDDGVVSFGVILTP